MAPIIMPEGSFHRPWLSLYGFYLRPKSQDEVREAPGTLLPAVAGPWGDGKGPGAPAQRM